MNVLHVVAGLDEIGNGIAVATKLIAEHQRKEGHVVELVDTKEFIIHHASFIASRSEIWVHSMWLPETIKACRLVLDAGVPLVRMTHANLDPLRLHSKGWKKLPVWYLIERRLLNRSARVIATCAAEVEWNRAAGVTAPCEAFDLKACFDLKTGAACLTPRASSQPLHVLYLGRRHPLKGVDYLEQAVAALGHSTGVPGTPVESSVQLRIVSNHFGAALEDDWAWADVLVLPTLSENFGLVVAEALEHQKLVITTDGAPAWAPEAPVNSEEGIENNYGGRLLYLKGYREGDAAMRVKLLEAALKRLMD